MYTTGIDTSSPTIEAALTTATGFTKVAEWTFPVAGNPPLHTSIYRIDAADMSFNTSRLVMAPDALARLVVLLGADGAAGTAAAGRIAHRGRRRAGRARRRRRAGRPAAPWPASDDVDPEPNI